MLIPTGTAAQLNESRKPVLVQILPGINNNCFKLCYIINM